MCIFYTAKKNKEKKAKKKKAKEKKAQEKKQRKKKQMKKKAKEAWPPNLTPQSALSPDGFNPRA